MVSLNSYPHRTNCISLIDWYILNNTLKKMLKYNLSLYKERIHEEKKRVIFFEMIT
jgi:hypothetical protein